MNERIQELMKQSMVEYQFDLRFSPEKFAELIVKECIKISQVGSITENKLKDHFGVNNATD